MDVRIDWANPELRFPTHLLKRVMSEKVCASVEGSPLKCSAQKSGRSYNEDRPHYLLDNTFITWFWIFKIKTKVWKKLLFIPLMFNLGIDQWIILVKFYYPDTLWLTLIAVFKLAGFNLILCKIFNFLIDVGSASSNIISSTQDSTYQHPIHVRYQTPEQQNPGFNGCPNGQQFCKKWFNSQKNFK